MKRSVGPHLMLLLVLPLSCVAVETDWKPPEQKPSVVRQRRNDDCGLAALATLLGLLGKPTNYEELAAAVTVNRRGVSMQTLARLAAQHEVATNGFRFAELSFAARASEGHPWIALLGAGTNGHYVVIRAVVADTVFALDPASGSRAIKRRAFSRLWTGYALLIE